MLFRLNQITSKHLANSFSDCVIQFDRRSSVIRTACVLQTDICMHLELKSQLSNLRQPKKDSLGEQKLPCEAGCKEEL